MKKNRAFDLVIGVLNRLRWHRLVLQAKALPVDKPTADCFARIAIL